MAKKRKHRIRKLIVLVLVLDQMKDLISTLRSVFGV